MDAADLTTSYSLFRVLLVSGSLLACAAIFKRPTARGALVLVLSMNLAAWAAYVAPLARPYGLLPDRDRIFNYGNAAIVASGSSPFDQVQVGFTNLEPLWSAVGAVLAGFNPENVLTTYGALTPLALLAVGLGLFRGFSQGEDEDDRWERVFLVFAALGLASISIGQNPLRPQWVAMFLFKPNHAFAWALMGLAVAWRSSWWRLGAVLSLLAWVFIIYWAFFLPALIAAAFLLEPARRRLKSLFLGMAVSIAAALPYIAHLLKDFNPLSAGRGAVHMWADPLAAAVRLPHWVTLDLGLLGVLAVLGALTLKPRTSVRDAHLAGIGVVATGLTILYTVAAFGRGLPSPDEQHYQYRFALSLLAGRALFKFAKGLETMRGWQAGQGSAVALALAIPLSFPAYWDPPGMDDYFRFDTVPISAKTLACGRFIAQNTPRNAVFAGGSEVSSWIPALSGRRVLRAGQDLVPRDARERRLAQEEIYFSRDEARTLAAARKYGITHIAIDGSLLLAYGEDRFRGIAAAPGLELVFSNSEVRILKLRN